MLFKHGFWLCSLLLTAFSIGAQPVINDGGVVNAASYILGPAEL
jgi:hypothetical protein